MTMSYIWARVVGTETALWVFSSTTEPSATLLWNKPSLNPFKVFLCYPPRPAPPAGVYFAQTNAARSYRSRRIPQHGGSGSVGRTWTEPRPSFWVITLYLFRQPCCRLLISKYDYLPVMAVDLLRPGA